MTGEFGGRVRTGQTRIYVLWNRIKTPKGVVVNLDSPGSDALGRSGVDGEVDKHWGERIGNAFLLSLIQDAIGYAATRGNNQNAVLADVFPEYAADRRQHGQHDPQGLTPDPTDDYQEAG